MEIKNTRDLAEEAPSLQDDKKWEDVPSSFQKYYRRHLKQIAHAVDPTHKPMMQILEKSFNFIDNKGDGNCVLYALRDYPAAGNIFREMSVAQIREAVSAEQKNIW